MNTDFLLNYISERLSTQLTVYDHSQQTVTATYCRAPELANELFLSPTLIAQLVHYRNQSVPNIASLNLVYLFGIIAIDQKTIIVGPIKNNHQYQFNKELTSNDQDVIPAEATPYLNLNRLTDSLVLIHNLCHEFEVITEEVLLQNLSKNLSVIKQKYLDLLFQTRERSAPHNPYSQEVREISYVTTGDIVKLKQEWAATYSGNLGILGPTPLRSARNLGIVFITLISRAAMRGGLNSEMAYSLSDTYINEIEKKETPEAIYHLAKHAETEYTLLVKEARSDLTHSIPDKGYLHPYVSQAQKIISTNLHKNLTIPLIANQIGIHPDYLSRIFKQDTGQTIQIFMTQQKIRYAESLLVASPRSISEIATNIGYTSQSYFTSIFKKVTGYTPHQYRQQFSHSL